MDAFRVYAGTLPPEGRTYEIRLTATEAEERLGETGGVEFAGALEADLQVLPSGRDLFVLGWVRGRVSARCVRCLQVFENSLVEEIHVVFVDGPADGTGEVELHRADLEVEPLVDGSIDLVEISMGQVLVAVDPHPVCRTACRGLCPGCGQDRNRVECGCSEGPIDPRFSVLAGWKPKA